MRHPRFRVLAKTVSFVPAHGGATLANIRLRLWYAQMMVKLWCHNADVVILSGYSGAGKSLLLSRLVKAGTVQDLLPTRMRLGIVDFGDLALDADSTSHIAVDEAQCASSDMLERLVAFAKLHRRRLYLSTQQGNELHDLCISVYSKLEVDGRLLVVDVCRRPN